ncbi:radical SAM/SPASM domain-containing protein [Clostridium thermarum]|uniref:radical SAM/SPASM domain-containing protein n=1 Tax=Clostridium thermarum TaxID=1716543 RepID=UPI00112415C5|nr:radical SAM/SPASM domain-containing protein [Clostridium thermarum]
MKRFKKVYIEITNVCNLACTFCPKTKRKPQFIKIEEFEHILDEAKPFTDHVYLHLKGEPMLHPNLPDLLDLCQERKLKVNITTNGTLIGKIREKIIMKPAIRQINISLHSFDANEGTRSMEEYLKDILDFTKEAVEKTNIIIALRLWNLDQSNITNAERQKNRELLSIIEEYLQLPYKIEEKITDSRGIKLADRVFLNQDYEFKWPGLEEEDYGNEGTCYGLRDQIGILVDGTVVPCCLDGEGAINLGNIHRQPFDEIIKSHRARKMLEGFAKRQLCEELCRRCGYRKRFN